MSTIATTAYEGTEQEPNACDPRPKYIVVGTDGEASDHVFRTTDNSVHVIDDANREHVEHLGARSIDEWMSFVDARRGWVDRRLWRSLGNSIDANIAGMN